MNHLGDNPQALAHMIKSLGGSIVDDASFSFPVNRTKDIVPKLGEFGIEVRPLHEYVSTNPRSGKIENVCIAKAYKRGSDGEAT
jgi:hypothetical protein